MIEEVFYMNQCRFSQYNGGVESSCEDGPVAPQDRHRPVPAIENLLRETQRNHYY